MAGDRVEDNLNPVGRMYYAASTMICVPTSLDQRVGAALGAQRNANAAQLDSGGTAVGSVCPRRPLCVPCPGLSRAPTFSTSGAIASARRAERLMLIAACIFKNAAGDSSVDNRGRVAVQPVPYASVAIGAWERSQAFPPSWRKDVVAHWEASSESSAAAPSCAAPQAV